MVYTHFSNLAYGTSQSGKNTNRSKKGTASDFRPLYSWKVKVKVFRYKPEVAVGVPEG
jgi:hypothetical protein